MSILDIFQYQLACAVMNVYHKMNLIAVMDETTAKGMSPEYVADKIIEAVAAETKEIVLAPLSHKFAILLRTLAPSLYFLIMSRRAAA